MSGRMNWDRVRTDSVSSHHGSERVNSLAEGHSHSRPTKSSKVLPRRSNNPHPKTCRCDACKAYLQLIRKLNPQRYEELRKTSETITRPGFQTKRRSAEGAIGSRNIRLSNFNPPPMPVHGCTCGKSLGFTGLHKKKCALMGITSAPVISSPQVPIVGCTCGRTFGFAVGHKRKCALMRLQSPVNEESLFGTEAERDVALATFGLLKQFERRSNDLKKPENVKRILARVQDALTSCGGELAANAAYADFQSLVSKAVDVFIENSINIPRVVLLRQDDVHVTPGFTTLRPQSYFIPKDVSHRDFRFTLDERLYSRGVLFGGFKRCLSASQQFQSEAERRFSLLLEDSNDPTVVKWIKPEQGIFQIYEDESDDAPYQPDFLVETRTCKLICDLRNHHRMRQSEVQRASELAAQWCEFATQQEKQNGGKPWSYLLIPEYAVKDRPSWALWRTQLRIESPTKFEQLFA